MHGLIIIPCHSENCENSYESPLVSQAYFPLWNCDGIYGIMSIFSLCDKDDNLVSCVTVLK